MASDDPFPRARLRTMQIVAAALTSGVLLFGGILMSMTLSGRANPAAEPPLPIVTIMAGAFFVFSGTLSVVLPKSLVQAGLKRFAAESGTPDVLRLVELRQTTMIVGMALLEGTAFFGLIAYLVERQTLVLLVPGLALTGLLLRFPTEGSVRNWLEASARRVQEMRQDRAT